MPTPWLTKEELREFLVEYNIDICLLTETHARPCNKINFPNYNTYRTDRIHHRGGGTAILSKRNLNTSLFRTSNDRGFEETNIILIHDNRTLHISAVYSPPSHRLTADDIRFLIPSDRPTIIGGDLNTKHTIWGCRNNNKNGILFQGHMSKFNIKVIAPTHPTHYSQIGGHRPDILDFFATNTDLPMSAAAFNELSSDHLPVVGIVGIRTYEEPPMVNITDWDLFHNILETSFKQTDHTNIDTRVDHFTRELQAAHGEATKQKPKISKQLLLPAEVRQIVQYRNYIRKKWQTTRNPTYKSHMNKLNKEIKVLTGKVREQRWENKVATLCTEDNSLWSMSRALRRDPAIARPIHGERG